MMLSNMLATIRVVRLCSVIKDHNSVSFKRQFILKNDCYSKTMASKHL